MSFIWRNVMSPNPQSHLQLESGFGAFMARYRGSLNVNPRKPLPGLKMRSRLDDPDRMIHTVQSTCTI